MGQISGQWWHSGLVRAGLAGCIALLAANCSVSNQTKIDPVYGVAASPRVMNDGEEIPKGNGRYRVGRPYVVAGVTYVPQHDPNYRATGTASWYGDAFHGRLTANGEVFDMRSITAAHPTLPLPSYVRVTNLANKRSLIVRVNDRGPFHANRVIDVSSRAADLLGFRHHGVARVKVEYVAAADIKGSDDMKLAATLRLNGQPAPAPSPVMVASSQKPLIPEPEARPVPQAQPRAYRVAGAGANAWAFPQAQRRAPQPRTPVQQATVHAPAANAAAPMTAPRVQAGFTAAPPVQATSFSPASVSGRGLY